MLSPTALMKCLGKSLLKGLVPGGGLIAELLEEAIRTWKEQRSAHQRRDELESLSRLAADEAKAVVEEVLREIGANANPQVKEAIGKYLQRVPQSIRESLERPEDPAGHSLRPGMDVDSQQEVLNLLPPGLPVIAMGGRDSSGSGSNLPRSRLAETQEVIPLEADEDFPEEFSQELPAEGPRLLFLNSSLPPRMLDRPYYSVGRLGAKITLDDPHVSRRHLSLVQLGPFWVAINRSGKRMRIGSSPLRQRTLCRGDIIRIGNSILVWNAREPAGAGSSLRPWKTGARVSKVNPRSVMPGGRDIFSTLESLDSERSVQQGTLTLRRNGTIAAVSTGQPLLFGSHDICQVRWQEAGLQPVQAMLDWSPVGLKLLEFDRFPTTETLVRAGQTVTVGRQQFQVEFEGSLSNVSAQMGRIASATLPPVCLSVFYGPHTGETIILPLNESLTLGRSRQCDLALPEDLRVSSQHLQLRLIWAERDKRGITPILEVTDLGSRNGTVINREPLQGMGEACLGDVIQFGNPRSVAPSALILHYPLAPCSWADETESPE